MLNIFPYLYNNVHYKNIKSIAWLHYCKAIINEIETYGIEQEPFHYFYFKK